MARNVRSHDLSMAAPSRASRLWLRLKERMPFLIKSGSAILDQGLFAGTNFLLNVLLARMLLEVQYGAFATTYAVFLLLGSLYIAIIIEPMLVFGSGKFSERFSRYLGIMIYSQTLLTIGLSIILLIGAYFFQETGQGLMSEALLGMSIAQPFILLQWTLRRAFYVNSQPQWAASGGVLYLVLMVAGIAMIGALGLTSAFFALMVMGVVSLIVAVYFMVILKPQLFTLADDLNIRMIFMDHVKYGRWSVSTMFLTWIPNNIYYTILPLIVGLQGSAALRASMNLIMPVLHANTAISVLLAPTLVRALKHDGVGKMHQRTRLGLLIFGFTSGLYWFILLVGGNHLIDLLYDGRYNAYVSTPIFLIMGLIPFTHGAGEILSGALRAMGHLNSIFKGHLVAGGVTLTMSVFLLLAGGVTGAYIGLLLSSVTAASVIYYFYQKGRHEMTDERIQELHFMPRKTKNDDDEPEEGSIDTES